MEVLSRLQIHPYRDGSDDFEQLAEELYLGGGFTIIEMTIEDDIYRLLNEILGINRTDRVHSLDELSSEIIDMMELLDPTMLEWSSSDDDSSSSSSSDSN